MEISCDRMSKGVLEKLKRFCTLTISWNCEALSKVLFNLPVIKNIIQPYDATIPSIIEQTWE